MTEDRSDGERYESTDEIVSTLVGTEGSEVVLIFEESITVPTTRTGVRGFDTETLSNATVRATVEQAEIEDYGESFTCFATVGPEEVERLGLAADAVDPDGKPTVSVRIVASRGPGESELTVREAKAALEEGEHDALPSWRGRPRASVSVLGEENGDGDGRPAREHELGTVAGVSTER